MKEKESKNKTNRNPTGPEKTEEKTSNKKATTDGLRPSRSSMWAGINSPRSWVRNRFFFLQIFPIKHLGSRYGKEVCLCLG
jgi:hypothetical protein